MVVLRPRVARMTPLGQKYNQKRNGLTYIPVYDIDAYMCAVTYSVYRTYSFKYNIFVLPFFAGCFVVFYRFPLCLTLIYRFLFEDG